MMRSGCPENVPSWIFDKAFKNQKEAVVKAQECTNDSVHGYIYREYLGGNGKWYIGTLMLKKRFDVFMPHK